MTVGHWICRIAWASRNIIWRDIGIWAGADRLVVIAAINRTYRKWYPGVAVVKWCRRICIAVNNVRTGRRIRHKRAAGLLIGPQNWIQAEIGR